jgi:hypothetical protein
MKIENNRQYTGMKLHSKEKKYTGNRMMNKGKGEEAAAYKQC